MRILVCGGRHYANRAFVFARLDALHAKYGVEFIDEGGAPGADKLAREWAWSRGVGNKSWHADWKRYGRAAGPIRNGVMLAESKPDGVVAFPGGRGTADMVAKALSAGLKVWDLREPAVK